MSLSSWLRPVLVGPCLSLSFLATALSLVGRVGESQSRFWLWLQSMAYSGILAMVCVGSLLLVDWTLFKANQRKLPTGRRAWYVSVAMPIICTVVYQLLDRSDDYRPNWFATLVLPALGIAALLRWTFSDGFAPVD
jgi:hypothetical protein